MKPFNGIGTMADMAARWISVPIMPATMGVSTTPGLTASELADLELAYAPAYGSAKNPVNMLGYVADNLRPRYGSPSRPSARTRRTNAPTPPGRRPRRL